MSLNQWHIIYLGVFAVGIYLIYTVVKPVASGASNLISQANQAVQTMENAASSAAAYGDDFWDSMDQVGMD
jgi:predicted PurR-regulated permease PerM